MGKRTKIDGKQFSKLLNKNNAFDLEANLVNYSELTDEGGFIQFENFDITNRLDISSLFKSTSIVNSTVEEIRIIGDLKESSLDIIGNSNIKRFKIVSKSKTLQLFISENTTIIEFNVSDDSYIGTLAFSGEVSIESLLIMNRANIEDADISQNSSIRSLSLFNNSKIENLSLSNTATIEALDFHDSSACDKFYMDNYSTLGSLRMYDNTILNIAEFYDKITLDEIYFGGGTIGKTFKLKNITTNEVNITGNKTTFNGPFIIEDLKINLLHIYDFSINETIRLNQIKPLTQDNDTRINLIKSSFKKIELIDNSFHEFSKLKFENCDLTNAFISSTKFPENIVSEHKEELKSFYEQLKIVYQRQGNRTESLIYQAKELNTHYQILAWKSDFWDKLTLVFNKYTTNFGTSWTRGFLALFISSLVLFTLLLWSTKSVIPVWPWEMSSLDFKLFASQYFDFINPTSYIWKRWDFIYDLEGGEVSWGVKALLLFSKVVIVTIIYQIIQAFRKFGRK